MTKILILVSVLLAIALISALEVCSEQRKRLNRQRDRILTLCLESSELQKEIDMLTARLQSKENHENNMMMDKVHEAEDAIRQLQRRFELRERLKDAMERKVKND